MPAPACLGPLYVLLVVDGEHALRAAALGQERVEAVERANVEYAQSLEALGQSGNPVPVVAGDPRRVDARLAAQEKRVEPEGHALQHRVGLVRARVDGQEVGNLLL